MFTQDGTFWTGWAGVYDAAGNLIGAESIGFGILGLFRWLAGVFG